MGQPTGDDDGRDDRAIEERTIVGTLSFCGGESGMSLRVLASNHQRFRSRVMIGLNRPAGDERGNDQPKQGSSLNLGKQGQISAKLHTSPPKKDLDSHF